MDLVNLPKLQQRRRAPGNRSPNTTTSSKNQHCPPLITNPNNIFVLQFYNRQKSHSACYYPESRPIDKQHNTELQKSWLLLPYRTRVRFGTADGWSWRWRWRRVLRFPQYELIGFRSGVIVAD